MADRLGLSPVPLYLLGGLAFGTGGLLPVDAPEGFFDIGAEVGVVLLLLLLGLEYSAEELVRNLRLQAPVGALDVVLNGLPGAVAAVLLGWGPVGALALAGITAISSSGIVAKVVSDMGRLGNRETPAVLAVLVLEDLAMAVYLPVLTALVIAESATGAVRSVGIALALLAAVLFVALRHGHRLSAPLRSDSSEVLLLGILGLALLVAGAAEQVGVSAAVGAFLLGIALSGEVVEQVRPLLEPLRDLFAAVFFVFFGLQTDPGLLPAVAGPALALVVVGVLTKMVSGWFAARQVGAGIPGRVRAGATLTPRGEFSIVIAGLAAGVEPGLAALAAAYVLVLAVLGPVLARAADPLGRALQRRSAARAATT